MRKHDTNDTKHKEVIDLLKDLPFVDAPENFEYNLKVRIENGEFNTSQEETKPRIFNVRTLFPSAAAVVTALILIFVFYNDSETPPTNPSEETTAQQAAVPASELPNEYIIKKKTPVNPNKSSGNKSDEQFYTEDTYRVVVQPNDVVVEEKIDLPFNNGGSINLDNFISGSDDIPVQTSGLQTVGTGTPPANKSNYYNFNGFYIRKQMDDESLKEFKSRIDSIRKLMKQFDKGARN